MVEALARQLMQTHGTDTGSWRGKVAHALLTCAIFSATLWDFRVHDLRIFDGIALLCLAGFLLLNRQSLDGWLRARRDYLFLFAVIVIYAALGYALHLHRSSLAIIVFAVLALHLIAQPGWIWSARIYKPLIVVHLAAFLVQYLSFMLLDRLIDIFSDASRLLSGAQGFKPAGLFREANSFCLNMFVIATLAILYRPNRILAGFAALAMMSSGSLWGLGAAVVLIFLNEIRAGGTIVAQTRGFVGTLVVLLVVLNIHLWLEKPATIELPYLYDRISKILTDSGARERYIQNTRVATTISAGRVVVDDAGILDAAARVELTAKLAALESKTSHTLVVVTVQSLGGRTVEDYGATLGRILKVGQTGERNRVLLIVAPKERKVHIEVSDGLEGTLTDAVAKSIIESSIMPNFKANDIPTGIYRGADDIAQALSGEADNIKRRPPLLATPDCNGCREKISLQIAPQIARITGEGLSTKYFFEGLPANGIHFLFKSLGVVGLILLSAGLAVALRGLPWVEKFFVAGSIAFAFTTYPIATYLIFWIWLSSLFVFVRHRSAGRAANTSEHG